MMTKALENILICPHINPPALTPQEGNPPTRKYARFNKEIMVKNDWLFKRLKMFADQSALIWQDRKYSYQEMSDGVSGYRKILKDCDIKEGECVALYGDFSPDITMLLLALIQNRNIAVPLTPSVSSAMGTA